MPRSRLVLLGAGHLEKKTVVSDNAGHIAAQNRRGITSASIEAIFSKIVLIFGSAQNDVEQIARSRPPVTLLEL